MKPALLRYAKRSEMLIVYIVSFLKAFAFAGVVKQGKDAAVLALDNDAGDVDPPSLRGAVLVDSFFGKGEDATCGPIGEICHPKWKNDCCYRCVFVGDCCYQCGY